MCVCVSRLLKFVRQKHVRHHSFRKMRAFLTKIDHNLNHMTAWLNMGNSYKQKSSIKYIIMYTQETLHQTGTYLPTVPLAKSESKHATAASQSSLTSFSAACCFPKLKDALLGDAWHHGTQKSQCQSQTSGQVSLPIHDHQRLAGCMFQICQRTWLSSKLQSWFNHMLYCVSHVVCVIAKCFI